MLAQFKNYLENGTFLEAHEVVKSFIVIIKDERYKIEIKKLLSDSNYLYTVACYQEIEFKNDTSNTYTLWNRIVGFPWVAAENLDLAISQALGFLADRK